MTNTPSPRPDVEGIEALAKAAVSIDRLYGIARQDIPALIAWIETLEARQVKLEGVVEAARLLMLEAKAFMGFEDQIAPVTGWPNIHCLKERIEQARKARAALGDGDG